MPELTRDPKPSVAKQSSQEVASAASASTSETFRAQVEQTRRASEALARSALTAASGRRDEIDRVFAGLRSVAEDLTPDTSASHDERQRLLQDAKAGEQREIEAHRRLAEQVATALESAATTLAARPSPGTERHAADLARLTGHAVAALEQRAQEMRNRQAVEHSRVAAALADDSPMRLRNLGESQETELQHQARADARLLDFVASQAEALQHAPSAERVSALRQALGAVGADLRDAALKRIALDTRRLMERVDANATNAERTRTVVDAAVRGALAEELSDQRREQEVAARGDTTTAYVAGHRVTDGYGNQLTDGVVLASHESHDEITEAYEVKAGAPSARDLFLRLQEDYSDEPARYARDSAADPLDRSEVERLDKELMSRAAQREPGQLAATRERLDVQRVFVDGVELRLRDEHRRLVEVQAVLPRDARPKTQALRLEHTQEDLRRAAAAATELIRRWREEG